MQVGSNEDSVGSHYPRYTKLACYIRLPSKHECFGSSLPKIHESPCIKVGNLSDLVWFYKFLAFFSWRTIFFSVSSSRRRCTVTEFTWVENENQID